MDLALRLSSRQSVHWCCCFPVYAFFCSISLLRESSFGVHGRFGRLYCIPLRRFFCLDVFLHHCCVLLIDHNDIIISINNKINSSSNSRGCGFRGKGRKRPIYLDLSGFFLVYPAFIFRLTMFKKIKGKSIPQKNGWKTKNMLKTSLKMWKT